MIERTIRISCPPTDHVDGCDECDDGIREVYAHPWQVNAADALEHTLAYAITCSPFPRARFIDLERVIEAVDSGTPRLLRRAAESCERSGNPHAAETWETCALLAEEVLERRYGARAAEKGRAA